MDVDFRTILDWNDVRAFLAVSRAGSLSGAARSLRVNHATISRRLSDLEASIGGGALFERARSGYTLTDAGRRALAAGEQMEAAAEAFRRGAEAGDALAGPVRVSATSTFAEHILAVPLARLARAHEMLEIELSAEDRNVSLARGEADIAVRFGRPARETALVRRVGTLRHAFYATSNYLEEVEKKDRRLIGFSDAVASIAPVARRIAQLADGRTLAMRGASYAIQAKVAAAGGGMALLPCYLGDAMPGLIRVDDEPNVTWAPPIWLVIRPDARRVARVTVVAEQVAAACRAVDEAVAAG